MERLRRLLLARLPRLRRARGRRAYPLVAGRAEPGRRVVGEILRLSRIIGEADPDVVHLHSSKAGLVGRMVLRNRVPTVFQPHAWSYLAATGGVRAASLRWERFATRWAAVRVCQRRGAGDRRSTGHRRSHHGDPQRGLLVDVPAPGQPGPVAARKLLGCPRGPPPSASASSTPQKGQPDLLGLVRGRPPGPGRAAGGHRRRPGSRRDLLRLAAELPGVTLVGARSDIRAWLAAADVVVVPSRWDGMSAGSARGDGQRPQRRRHLGRGRRRGHAGRCRRDRGAPGPRGDGGRGGRAPPRSEPGMTRAGQVAPTSRRTTTSRPPRTSWPVPTSGSSASIVRR